MNGQNIQNNKKKKLLLGQLIQKLSDMVKDEWSEHSKWKKRRAFVGTVNIETSRTLLEQIP